MTIRYKRPAKLRGRDTTKRHCMAGNLGVSGAWPGKHPQIGMAGPLQWSGETKENQQQQECSKTRVQHRVKQQNGWAGLGRACTRPVLLVHRGETHAPSRHAAGILVHDSSGSRHNVTSMLDTILHILCLEPARLKFQPGGALSHPVWWRSQYIERIGRPGVDRGRLRAPTSGHHSISFSHTVLFTSVCSWPSLPSPYAPLLNTTITMNMALCILGLTVGRTPRPVHQTILSSQPATSNAAGVRRDTCGRQGTRWYWGWSASPPRRR